MWVGHKNSSQGIERQGHRSRSWSWVLTNDHDLNLWPWQCGRSDLDWGQIFLGVLYFDSLLLRLFLNRKQTAVDRDQTDRVSLTLTLIYELDLQSPRSMVVTYAHTQVQCQTSIRSDHTEWKQTTRRTKPIKLPSSLTRSVNMTGCLQCEWGELCKLSEFISAVDIVGTTWR